NWAGRFGVSYSPWNRTALRAGFGIFHDRPFDNFLLDPRNNMTTANTVPDVFPTSFWDKPVNFQQSIAQAFLSGPPAFGTPYITRIPLQQFPRTLDNRITHSDPVEMLWVDENLRTPYVQSWFASLQQRMTGSFEIDVNAAGGLARKLLSSDLVNRVCSL